MSNLILKTTTLVQMLTRSVRAFKMDCFNDAPLATAVRHMLQDPDPDCQVEACLALCNLGHSHCPTRRHLLEQVRASASVLAERSVRSP